MKIKIEKGIPLPTPRGKSNEIIAALMAAKIGDSFLVPLNKRNNMGTWAARAKVKITTRVDGETHLRVWRTA